MDPRDFEKAKESVEELNEVLDMTLAMADAAKEAGTLEKISRLFQHSAPVINEFFKSVWGGEQFEQIVVMGNASYLARALISANKLTPYEVAVTSVQIAREIVRLSKEK